MAKFKVGDRVKVVNTLGHDAKVGMTGEIVKVDGNIYGVRLDKLFGDGHDLAGKCEQGHGQWITGENLELVGDNQKIVITSDGKTTLARLYEGKEVVKTAEANCAPNDEFDFTKGAKIAFARLTNTFKVGDKIIGNEKANRYCTTKKGWIGTVKQVLLDQIVAVGEDDVAFHLEPDCFDLYVEPKYYSGRLVCVESDLPHYWTVGKIYECVNGTLPADIKNHSGLIKCKDLDDINTRDFAQFIELKE